MPRSRSSLRCCSPLTRLFVLLHRHCRHFPHRHRFPLFVLPPLIQSSADFLLSVLPSSSSAPSSSSSSSSPPLIPRLVLELGAPWQASSITSFLHRSVSAEIDSSSSSSSSSSPSSSSSSSSSLLDVRVYADLYGRARWLAARSRERRQTTILILSHPSIPSLPSGSSCSLPVA